MKTVKVERYHAYQVADPVPPAGEEAKAAPGDITFSLSEPVRGWTVPLYEQHVVARLQAEVERLKALSVTNIMLDVVPGDGDGHEVFAKSVDDVTEKLTKFCDEVERLEQIAIDRKNELTSMCTQVVDLQSELTKARELISSTRATLGLEVWDQWAGLNETRDALDAFLAHQSTNVYKE